MTFNFAGNGEKVKAGIEFASRYVLRFGVALLGRIRGRLQTEGLLIGGAAAIYGASAVTPKNEESQRLTLFILKSRSYPIPFA
jgi:uncharacterized membrane protein YadS